MGKSVIEIKSKNGTVYLYEDKSYWDKEKGYSTHERKCIGKVGPEGKPIYNEYYKTREKMRELATDANNPGGVSATTFVGETLVLDKVSSSTGIQRVLAESFGESDAKKIAALAYYQICRGKALSNAGDWLEQRGFQDLGMSSQRVSELLERLKEDKINSFFKLWAHEHAEKGNLLFDLTSVSTYGKRNPYAEYGYNRDGESLEQINLALLTACGSGLPMWYHIYFDPGRKDKTIANFMQKLRVLKDELEDGGKLIESHRGLYERYFIIKDTPVRGRKVSYNDEAIQEFIDSDSCYWVLISTSAKTAFEALGQYRERNGVEVYFDDEKNLLDLRRLKNHNEQTIRGKIFVTFVSLIILSQLRKMVDKVEKKKRKYWSEHDMLRKVETYAKIHFEGKYKDVYTTPTSAQRLVFDIFGIPYTFKGKVKSQEEGD